ncbi:MAG: NUDIX domain-containing protein [Chitinophagales bacterium]|jgi:isopentenyldiphosphate isomerase|nr:NUDIX domain-containing protein [Sphingobacteriales bacterium]
MESWDLYNAEGELQEISIRRSEPIPEGLYHRIVHIWIYNEKQEFLIQKRAPHLSWFPNRWATTTGSMVSGENDIIQVAYREVEEELGLKGTQLDLEMQSEFTIGTSLVTLFSGFLPSIMLGKIILNDEVSDIKWMEKSRIEELRKEDSFAAYNQETFDIAYRILAKV